MNERALQTAGTDAVEAFLAMLVRTGFSGDVATDLASRVTLATDNSIYELLPRAVLFPRHGTDLALAARAASRYGVPIVARGGGTGTNGQALTGSVVVDTSRHMNTIRDFDPEHGRVTVGPGVVLDQLNAFLRPHGLFFPPNVSTASRATIGGMVATDASGKGSRLYGRTSDYIEAMEVVLADGQSITVRPLSAAELDAVCARTDRIGAIHREVRRVVTENAELIEATFPRMNRGLTGYNLKSVMTADGRFLLSYLLAGSEGTLALTEAITLRVVPLPRQTALVAVRYPRFDAALRDVARLLAADPVAIETIDDVVLSLAREDVVASRSGALLGEPGGGAVGGLNVVEVVGDDAAALTRKLDDIVSILSRNEGTVLGWSVVTDRTEIAQVWALRSRAVGLLGRLGGGKQGVAFVEDTAVPPEHLVPFVAEFRAILDAAGLAYGMYGHADVGCLHVRPAMDMTDPADQARILPISDAVATLTRKYGGLLWGEHGRGFRGQYSPFFFGETLYAELCRIKAAFDPLNILNPGKLSSPSREQALVRIDDAPLRGELDRRISDAFKPAFAASLACNGNGECFSWDPATPMCPSYKVTGDRRQSPKGRAALLREWARRSSAGESAASLQALEGEVFQALDTCLSCKACASTCPVRVDIPAMKARFLHHYHERVPRRARDHLMSQLERVLPLARRMPGLANAVIHNRLSRAALEAAFGLVDLPRLAPPSRRSASPPEASVILLEDNFTGSFDGPAVDAIHLLLERLGHGVRRVGPIENGKALHVLGMLERFGSVARANRQRLNELATTGLPLVGAEAVTNLMPEAEYREADPGGSPAVRVMSIDEFLVRHMATHPLPRVATEAEGFRLFLHCTEQTARPETASNWAAIFAAMGMKLEVVRAGCCGMAGMFGHEREHAGMSSDLFARSWSRQIDIAKPDGNLATGFSCRCQTERHLGFRPRHPAEALVQMLASTPANESSRGNDEHRN